jgi:hypothetical protein
MTAREINRISLEYWRRVTYDERGHPTPPKPTPRPLLDFDEKGFCMKFELITSPPRRLK